MVRVEHTRPQLLSRAGAEVAEHSDEQELARNLDHLPPPAAPVVHHVELPVATEVARLKSNLLCRARLVERTRPRRAPQDGQSGAGHADDQQKRKRQPWLRSGPKLRFELR